ncbi:anti-sigma factor family protein [Chitinophaga nivalis]|uniref:Zf-HC2 domain-containing protein n=1 Tax=Chitinophaga nivalis TaxID=2991709 RepID=A0ABT3IHI9_9BACT|nr:zf-HC2 domain-containing protein [Chitinophaga nivalis]MCW3466887.1 zf-HC2 domain-containing protein [Chitinophaga nivalis]MCW3483422.1 zf-HC2 domain-containing protein [Chitinophaga nivalis]
MNEHFNDIFVTTGCPSQQQLLDYVQGKLTAEEQHEVEMHLADCELCSDALEGLASIRDKEKIPGWIHQMKWDLLKKLRKRTRTRRKTENNIYLTVIILSILFLLLALFWMYHFSSQH